MLQIRTRNQKRKRRKRTDPDRGRNPGNGTDHIPAIVRLSDTTPTEIGKVVGTGIGATAVAGIKRKVEIENGSGAIVGTNGNGVKAGAHGNGKDPRAGTSGRGKGVTAGTEESATEAIAGRKGNGKEATAETEENGIAVMKKSRKGRGFSRGVWEFPSFIQKGG